jgi:hypothetical protein
MLAHHSLLLIAALAHAPSQNPTPAGASEPTSPFGAPLFVNGRRIPDLEIQRFLCHGLGSKQVDVARFQILIDQELERRKAAGEDMSKYEVGEAEFERYIERAKQDFKLKYPTLDYQTEVSRALLSVDLYRESSRQSMLFDKLFFPENPQDWPEMTREIIRQNGGEPFLADAQQSYEARKARQLEQGLPDIPPDDPIFTDTLRSWVLEALNDYSEQTADPERLGPGVLMNMEGVGIPIERIWQQIQAHVTPDQLDAAKRFLVLTSLVRDDLAAQEKLLKRADWEKEFAKDKSYNEAIHDAQMLAVNVMGFPSLEAFAEYCRLRDSYKRIIADELASDEKLNAEIAPTNLIAGVARVDCEIILCSAYDFEKARWKEDGWATAEQHAREIKQMLDDGADWTSTLELHSQFWDPPIPEVGNRPQHGMYFKGKFGAKTRMELQQFLKEHDFRSLLYGRNLTDKIFFDMPVGTISGPELGPQGYYIVRVAGRTPITKPLDLQVPIHRTIAETYHLKNHFERYAWGLLEAAKAGGKVTGI